MSDTEKRKPGRPVGTTRKEPTKVIRVPVSKVNKIKEFLKIGD